MAHISSVGGVNPCILAGRTLINDIRCNIAKGRTLIGDAHCDIEFGIPLGDIPVGETILMNVGGVETEFLVVNQGTPVPSPNGISHGTPNMYDSSCDGTWLLTKDIYERRGFNGGPYNKSEYHEYLNTTILGLFDAGAQDIIKEVKIPYMHGDDSGEESFRALEEGLATKIFLLSLGEVQLYHGKTGYEYDGLDGFPLSYFYTEDEDDGWYGYPKEERVAYYNGQAITWATRDMNTARVTTVTEDGSNSAHEHNSVPSTWPGLRFALVMPFETRVTKTKHRIIAPTAKKQYDPVFENNTWEDIIEACQSGIIPLTWKVGDSKVMKIGGANYQIDIIGRYHDRYANSAYGFGVAPLTLQLHNCLGQKYTLHNTAKSAFLSWEKSTMRTETLPGILTTMPAEVQSAIKEVLKYNRVVDLAGVNTTTDKLFLLSETEIFGDQTYSLGEEGTQYAYYADDSGNRIKTINGAACFWQERSPVARNAACVVFTNGGQANDAVTSTYGVSFAFCF